jgi:probable addiction module antidote protein
MPLKTRPFDPAAYLDSEAAIAAYMTEALDTNDPGFIADALGVLARARGMTQVARDAGLSRESLYRALSPDGNPELSTLLRVLAVLGLRLSVRPVEGSLNPREMRPGQIARVRGLGKAVAGKSVPS